MPFPFPQPVPPFNPLGLQTAANELVRLANQTAATNQNIVSTITQQIQQSQSQTNTPLAQIAGRVRSILQSCETDIVNISQLYRNLALREEEIMIGIAPTIEAEADQEAADAMAASQPQLVPEIYLAAARVITRYYADAVSTMALAARPILGDFETQATALAAMTGAINPLVGLGTSANTLLTGAAVGTEGQAALGTVAALRQIAVGVDPLPFNAAQVAAATLTPRSTPGSWGLFDMRVPGQTQLYIAKEAPESHLRSELATRAIALKVGLANDTLPVYAVEHGGTLYTVTPFAQGSGLRTSFAQQDQNFHSIMQQVPAEARARLLLLSYVTGESDRNPDNWLWDGSHMLSIDYGEGFADPGTSLSGTRGIFIRAGLQTPGSSDYLRFPISQSVLQDFTAQSTEIVNATQTYLGQMAAQEVRNRLEILRLLQMEANPTVGDLERLGGPYITYDPYAFSTP